MPKSYYPAAALFGILTLVTQVAPRVPPQQRDIGAPPAAAQSAAALPALSERIANYDITVKLDAQKKTLQGFETITWKNAQKVAANELRFHLYWNAWRNNQSTWMREDALRGRPRSTLRGERDWAYMDIIRVSVSNPKDANDADRAKNWRYDAPDDGNPDDTTVLVVPLSKPVPPGEDIEIRIGWESKILRTIARTGYRGNFFFIAHWFPAIGVWQADGTWNCHQFHSATEFFHNYGNYRVEMTVPAGWLLGATGLERSVKQNSDGTATHTYEQADVHTFTWTTSSEYREARRKFEAAGLKPVEMRLLYQPEHERQVERHFRATEAALKYYGTWFGEYPYGHVTIVDPAYGSGAGGMEYPTLFTAGTRRWNPFGGGSPEGVTVHEAGHQFWYGIVGNNEFEFAWLDEGLNTFSETRTTFAEYGPPAYDRRYFKEFVPVLQRDILTTKLLDLGWERYRRDARRDTQATPTFHYYPDTASSITYSKTGLWLETMERTYGWEKTRKILSTFFGRWKFKHPKPEDFFTVANEVAGEDLTPFFDEVHRKAVVFDYAVEKVTSEEVTTRGYVSKDGKIVPVTERTDAGPQPLYQTRVVVRRLGDGVLPVEVQLRFENGEELRSTWDGRDLWTIITITKPAKLEYAVVDPERKLALDVNFTNNSLRRVPNNRFATAKWASKWMIWMQDFLQTILIFV
jgi:hypothetical protein